MVGVILVQSTLEVVATKQPHQPPVKGRDQGAAQGVHLHVVLIEAESLEPPRGPWDEVSLCVVAALYSRFARSSAP